MATSTCAKCEGHTFEVVSFTPPGTNYKLHMVQCAGCGFPVTALDPAVSASIVRTQTAVNEIDERLSRIALALMD